MTRMATRKMTRTPNPIGQRAAVAPGHAERRNAVSRKPEAPTTRRGALTRERIKEAAARVLERLGYRAMRLQDIAEEADINVSLVYHYFSGKADLTSEILGELIARGTHAADPRELEDPFSAILDAHRRVVASYSDHPGLMRCLLHFDEEEADFAALYRRASLDWSRKISRDLARRCGDAPVSEEQRLMIAYALGAMVDGFLFELYVDRNPVMVEAFADDEEVAVFLGVLWYRAIYLANPPVERLGRFAAIADLQLKIRT